MREFAYDKKKRKAIVLSELNQGENEFGQGEEEDHVPSMVRKKMEKRKTDMDKAKSNKQQLALREKSKSQPLSEDPRM